MPVREIGQAGDAIVRLYTDVQGTLAPTVKIVQAEFTQHGLSLTLDQSVDLARLLITTATANGWGSDEDRERLIAWAPVKR